MFRTRRSDDAHRDQEDQKQSVEPPEAEEEVSALLRLHVRDVVAREEERDVRRDEHGQDAPPLVDPDEGVVARAGEERLKQREEQRHLDRADELAADAAPAVLAK